MKIVYCIASFSSKGGTEKVLSSKASYLAENGHEVTVIVSDQHEKKWAYSLSAKVRVIDLQITRKIKGRIKYVGFFQNVLQLRKTYNEELKKINPDVIIVLERGYEDFVIPYILPHIPKIREYHFSRKASENLENQLAFIQKKKRKLLRFFYESQYKRYDSLVLLTEKDKQFWRNWRNITVIPNIIDGSFLDEYDFDITKREKKIIAVGSMVEDRKGFSTLINIWSKLENKFPEWEFAIYGDGPYRSKYEEQIVRLGVKRLIMPGVSDVIHEKYQESQLFLMASKGEGFGLVLIEAQSKGLAVVSYDCYSGPSDILLNNMGGFLIPMGDEKEFMDKLEALLKNDELRIEKSKEALVNAQRFSTSSVMPLWIQLFDSLIQKQ